MKSHEELLVWQRAMELAEAVYEVARKLPKEEMFGLRSQITRAAVSIPSNIAEGNGRLTPGEFCQFLGVARGSLMELRTELLLLSRVGLVPAAGTSKSLALAEEVSKMLAAFLKRVSADVSSRRRS